MIFPTLRSPSSPKPPRSPATSVDLARQHALEMKIYAGVREAWKGHEQAQGLDRAVDDAVGSGGPFGKGLTNGTQNQLDFLPVQATDFVFAILAEELGFIGAMVLFALYIALLYRVLRSAWQSRDPFGLAFGSGVASMLLFQLVVNVGMVIGIMPITGIPLPFVTHGGASLISIAVGLGIIQSINIRQARAEW